MDSQEKVIADYKGVADVMLKHYGDKAWLEVLERMTTTEMGGLDTAPFWRGVLKELDKVKGQSND